MVETIVFNRLKVSRAESTLSSYSSGWNSYLKICESSGMKPYPVCQSKLVTYSALAHEKLGLLADTVRNYTAAIAFHHRIRGLQDPREDGNLLSLMLDGCKRTDQQRGYQKRLRFGVDGTMLVNLIASLDLTDFRQARFAAYMSVSYFGGFRSNELVLTKSGLRCLWRDFKLPSAKSGLSYFILIQRISKMLQFGPAIDIPLPITGGKSCPLKMMTNYRSFFNPDLIHGDMPAFMNLDGSPYTYKQALGDIRTYLERIGIESKRFGTHSFRIGMATEAGRVNVPDHIIQMLGRWNSECYKRYIQTKPETIVQEIVKLRGQGD